MLHNRGITGGQTGSRVLVQAASAVDRNGEVSPAALLLEGDEILQAGTPQAIGEVSGARIVEAHDEVVLPGLVNAHAHLDLSGPGPFPYEGDFEAWLEHVLELRQASTRAQIAADVARGVELSLAGGTAFIGDIAGKPHLPQFGALQASPLGGVSYPEFFGMGDTQQAAIDEIDEALALLDDEAGKLTCGLSPHAPYTCGPLVIQGAARRGVPMAIHVAESLDELEFLATGTGSFRKLLEGMGAWNDGVVVPGCHPIEHTLAQLTGRGGCPPPSQVLLVHLNYIEPHHLDLLAAAGVTVVYCPRASAYFGHPVTGQHAYRDMLDSGIPVALGTDSLLCLDTPDRISILDEMRFLSRRDGTPFEVLMQMATENGAGGLGFGNMGLFDFKPGGISGIIAVKAGRASPRMADVLLADDPPRWLLKPEAWQPGVPEGGHTWCSPVPGV